MMKKVKRKTKEQWENLLACWWVQTLVLLVLLCNCRSSWNPDISGFYFSWRYQRCGQTRRKTSVGLESCPLVTFFALPLGYVLKCYQLVFQFSKFCKQFSPLKASWLGVFDSKFSVLFFFYSQNNNNSLIWDVEDGALKIPLTPSKRSLSPSLPALNWKRREVQLARLMRRKPKVHPVNWEWNWWNKSR